MNLPEPNTTQETAWFAEQMEWKPWPGGHLPIDYPLPVGYCLQRGREIVVRREKEHPPRPFSPRTSTADAIELAVHLKIAFGYIGHGQTADEPKFYGGERSGMIVTPLLYANTLCTAICEAVRAKGNDGKDA